MSRVSDLKYGKNFEEEFAELVQSYGFSIEKLPKYDHFDFIIEGKIFVEVKNRRCNRDTYETTKVRLEKYSSGLIHILSGKKALLLINWDDDMGYIDLLETPPVLQVYESGRYDRGKEEFGYYAYFNIDSFKPFTKETILKLI